MISLKANEPLAPGMISVVWELAHELDRMRVPVVSSDPDYTGQWLTFATQQLRGPDGRTDNVNLRNWLNRLQTIRFEGEYRGDYWSAVLVSNIRFKKRGSIVHLLVPPDAIKALRSADTFAKIETAAAHQLPGHARQLYALLADKKRLGKPEWTYELGELRALMGVAGKKTYTRWDSFRSWVLLPAVDAINNYGTVTVAMEPVKRGRAVHAVKFSWAWKSLDEAQVTDEENERHSVARRKDAPAIPDAPPLVKPDSDLGDGEAMADPVVRAGMAQLLGQLGNKLRVDDPEGGG